MTHCHCLHIVLSPHPDDAALSCGGAIHRWATGDEPVLVVTAMTGDPPVGPLSDFAEYQHASWGVPAPEAYLIRRAEETVALERLGAGLAQLGLKDCIYRRDDSGSFYPSEEAIFGSIHPSDESLIDTLVAKLASLGPFAPGAVVYSPLGLGNHVDHQLIRRAAERWRGTHLSYYEDLPYAARMDMDQAAIQRREFGLTPRRVRLSDGDMSAKIDAIGRYRSQLDILFGGHAPMEAAVRAYGRAVAQGPGWAERFWQPVSANAVDDSSISASSRT